MSFLRIGNKGMSVHTIAKKVRISEAELKRIVQAADDGYSWALSRMQNLEESGFTPEDYHAVRLAIYTPLAKNGDSNAQCWLGLIADDFETSKSWYEKAAANGNTKAMKYLALDYYQRSDSENEIYWYRQAAEHGDPEGMYFLALEYRTGQSLDKNVDIAHDLLEKSAELGFPKAYAKLSEIYGYLFEEKKDDKKFLYYCRQAICSQDRDAAATAAQQLAYYYGGSIYFGREANDHTDVQRAMYWFHQAYFFDPDDYTRDRITEFSDKSGYVVSEEKFDKWLDENESQNFSYLPRYI